MVCCKLEIEMQSLLLRWLCKVNKLTFLQLVVVEEVRERKMRKRMKEKRKKKEKGKKKS